MSKAIDAIVQKIAELAEQERLTLEIDDSFALVSTKRIRLDDIRGKIQALYAEKRRLEAQARAQ